MHEHPINKVSSCPKVSDVTVLEDNWTDGQHDSKTTTPTPFFLQGEYHEIIGVTATFQKVLDTTVQDKVTGMTASNKDFGMTP